MRKQSEKWKKFGQLISIVDIRIQKEQTKMFKLKKQVQELEETIDDKWKQIENSQHELKTLRVQDEENSLARLFSRREMIKTQIEGLHYDVTVAEEEIDEVKDNIEDCKNQINVLEKKKIALDEIRLSIS